MFVQTHGDCRRLLFFLFSFFFGWFSDTIFKVSNHVCLGVHLLADTRGTQRKIGGKGVSRLLLSLASFTSVFAWVHWWTCMASWGGYNVFARTEKSRLVVLLSAAFEVWVIEDPQGRRTLDDVSSLRQVTSVCEECMSGWLVVLLWENCIAENFVLHCDRQCRSHSRHWWSSTLPPFLQACCPCIHVAHKLNSDEHLLSCREPC